jgi:hypothetical protein
MDNSFPEIEDWLNSLVKPEVGELQRRVIDLLVGRRTT